MAKRSKQFIKGIDNKVLIIGAVVAVILGYFFMKRKKEKDGELPYAVAGLGGGLTATSLAGGRGGPNVYGTKSSSQSTSGGGGALSEQQKKILTQAKA